VRAQNSCANSSYRTLSVTINNCPRFEDNYSSGGEINADVYPNPSDDYIYIKINNDISTLYTLTFIDMQGRIVKSWSEIISNNSIIEKQISDLSKGIYLLAINGQNGEQVIKKIIKQ
jgi:Secretion system C-terminal sorting domain